MADDLRILLSASLNIGKSIGDLNAAIKAIEQHPSLKKINLKIDIDQSFTQSISKFISSVEKMKKISDEQNKTVQETQDVYKKLDGTITTVTQKVLANGEVIQKTKTIHDDNRKAMQDETIAAQKLANAVDGVNKADLDAITILKNKANATTGFNVKSSQGYTVTNQRLESDGQTLVGARVTTDYKKQRDDATKAQEDILKATRANLLQEEREYQSFVENVKRKYESLQASINKNLLQEDKDTQSFVEKAKKQYDSLIEKQQELLLKIGEYQRRYAGDKNLVSNLGNVAVDAKSLNLIQDGEKGIQRLTSQMKEYVNQSTSATSHSLSFGEAMSTALSRIVQWGAATTLIYGSLRQIKEGVAYIVDLDNALNQVRIVTGKSQEEVSKLALEYNKLGKEMSVSTKEIALTGASLFRQGLDETQVKERMDAVIKYAKISSLSLEESDKIITASVNGTKAKASELIDVFSYLGDSTSTGADEIGRAFQKTASLAAIAGLDYKKLASYIATVSSVTRESAETIGNSFKSLLSRYQSIKEKGFNAEDATNINQVTKALKEVGDQTGTNIDAIDKQTGQLRNYGDVLDDLSKVWDKLNPKQKEYLQTVLGGTYQADKFAALMNNYTASINSYTNSLNVAGIANQKFQIWQESTAAKIEKFKATWESFWQRSLDSGTVKAFISLATSLMSSFDNLGTVVALATGIFVTFRSKAIASLITGAYSSVQALFATKTALLSTATAAEATSVAVNGTAIAMTGLQRALGIIGLVVTAASVLYMAIGNVDDGNKKLTQSIEDTNKKYADTRSELSNTLAYYKDNYKAISTNTDVKNQLFEMQNKLLDTFGKEASGLDLVNGKYDEQIKKIDALNGKNLENKIKDNQITVDTIQSKNYSKPTLGVALTTKSAFGMGDKPYEVGGDIGIGSLKFEEYYKQLLDLQDQIRNKNTDIFNGQALIPKSAKEWSNVLGSVQEKLATMKPFYDQIISLENDKKEQIKSSAVEQSQFNDEQKKFFDSLDSSIKKLSTKDYEAGIKGIVNTVKGFDGKNLSEVLDKIKELPEIKSNSNIVQELNNLSSSLKATSSETIDLVALQTRLVNAFEKTTQNVQPLNDAIDKMQQGHSLTSSEITSLLKKYPDLINAFTSENGMLKINAAALEEKRKIEIDGMQASLQADISTLASQEKALIAKLSMYGVEIDAINSVADAKKAASSIRNADPNASEVDIYGAESALLPQLNAIGKAKEAMKALQDAAKNGFKFENSLNNPNTKAKAEPTPFDSTENFKDNPFQRELKSLEGELKASESIMTRYKDTSQEYRNELQKQADIHTKQRDLQSGEANRIRDEDVALQHRLDAEKLSTAERNKVLKQLEDNKNTLADLGMKWWDYELAVSDSNKKITDSVEKESKAQFDISKKWIEDQVALNKLTTEETIAAWKRVIDAHKIGSQERIDAEVELAKVMDELNKKKLDNAKEVAKQAVDLQKKIFEGQRDVELKGIDDAMKAEDERHQKYMDNKDAEMNKTQDAIDLIKKSMNRDTSTEDYNNTLTKAQKDAQNTQNNINLYKLDNSIEGKAKLAELEKEYSAKQEEIQKLQSDRTKTLRENGLDDLLEGKKKEVDAAKKSEDAQYNLNKKNLDNVKSLRENYWKGVIENDATYLKIEQNIMNGHFDEVLKTFSGFTDGIKGFAQTMGEELNKNMTQEVKRTIDLINGYKGNPTAPLPNSSSPSSSNQSSGNYNPTNPAETNAIDMMKQNSDAWNNADAEKRKQLEQSNRGWGSSIGAVYKDGTWYKNGVPLYHEGGVIGSGGSAGNWLHKLLNLGQGEIPLIGKSGELMLKNPVDAISNLMKSIKMPNFDAIMPKTAMGGGDTINHFDIRIDKVMGGEDGAQSIFSAIKKKMQTGGYQ